MVTKTCKETNFEYGYRIITGIIRNQGYSTGLNTVQRIMQKFNLQCQVRPKRLTHYRGKESIVDNNIINREFKAERPLEKIVTDITYLPWGENGLYLSSIMDLYDGKIIAYTLGEKQDIGLGIDTLNQV